MAVGGRKRQQDGQVRERPKRKLESEPRGHRSFPAIFLIRLESISSIRFEDQVRC